MSDVLHVAPVAGFPVRFVASATAKPDVPWHVVEDLHAAMHMHRTARRQLIRGLRQDRRWAAEARVVRLGREEVTLASHSMAQGLLSATQAKGALLPGIDDDYRSAAFGAFNVEADALGLNEHQRAARLLEAVTGKPQPSVIRRIDVTTGEAVYNARELQAALGLSDDDMAAKVAEAEDLGLTRLVHPSKLAPVN